MDIRSLLEAAAQAFVENTQAGESLDLSKVISALSGLLGGNEDGSGIDLGQVVQTLQQGGLADLVQSWLGDGANQSIEAGTIQDMFGDQLSGFANQLGMDQGDAAQGLSQALPQLLDQASSGGSLLDSLVSGESAGLIASLASKLFGRS